VGSIQLVFLKRMARFRHETKEFGQEFCYLDLKNSDHLTCSSIFAGGCSGNLTGGAVVCASFQCTLSMAQKSDVVGRRLGDQLIGIINFSSIQAIKGFYVWARRALTVPDSWWSVLLFLLSEFF